MCPNEATLVRLLNGDLPDVQARDAAAHVQACTVCGEHYAQLRGVWESLGRWTVAPPAADLRGRVLRGAALDQGGAVAAQAATDGGGAARWSWMRLAASVVVAVGAGVGVAVVMTPAGGAGGRGDDVGHEEVVQVLGLDALGGWGALAAVFDPTLETREGETVEEDQP